MIGTESTLIPMILQFRFSNTGSNPVGATTPKLLEFSPQSLGAVGGGMRIPISVPIVLVELADHLLQI